MDAIEVAYDLIIRDKNECKGKASAPAPFPATPYFSRGSVHKSGGRGPADIELHAFRGSANRL